MQTRHLVETMETSTNTIGSSSHSYNRMPDILSKNHPPALYPIPRICEIPPPPPDPIPGPRATFRMPGLGDRTGRRRQRGRPHAARDAAHHGLPLRCGRRRARDAGEQQRLDDAALPRRSFDLLRDGCDGVRRPYRHGHRRPCRCELRHPLRRGQSRP